MTGWSVPDGYRMYPDEVNFAREVLDRHVEQGRGGRTALRFDGGEWSYEELQRRVNLFGSGLLALGVGRGEPVLFRTPNRPDGCAALLAVLKIGALPVMTSTLLREGELDPILDNSQARIAVTIDAVAEPLLSLRDARRLDRVIVLDGTEDGGNLHSFASVSERGRAELDAADTGADDPALLLYSSGTTGLPKGVLHTHRWVHAMGDAIQVQAGFRPDDVVLTPGEFSFLATLGHGLLIPLRVGATAALFAQRPKPDNVFSAIEAQGVTYFMSVPTFYRTVLAEDGIQDRFDLSAVRTWLSGGEALGATPVETWRERFGAPLFDMYGISEMQVVIGNSHANPIKAGSLGRRVPGIHLSLLDDELNEVGVDQPGVVAIRRDDVGLFAGYHRQPERWRAAHRGDWYVTGDVMSRDADGYYWYLGRQDDLFKTRGMFVSPQEVEDALLNHPSVAEAGVVGVPDPRLGNAVHAYVVLAAGHAPSDQLAQDIRDHAAGRLAHHKVPVQVGFLEALPKNIVGKILRRKLKEL